MSRRLALALAALLLGGCSAFDPAEDLPPGEGWLIAVKSCRLPDDMTPPVDLAHHAWFDIRLGSEDRWRRLEVISRRAFSDQDVVVSRRIDADTARATLRWKRDVHLHGVLAGPEAEAEALALFARADAYEDRRNYRGWAGPNSNTFVERLGREVAGLSFELHHNALGKDYTPLLRLGPTSSGTGLELETWLFGLQLGLREGLEVHLLQMTFGIDLWPPALKLPFLPRLGFPE